MKLLDISLVNSGKRRCDMNTVHIIIDTLKYSYIGAYGSEWVKTPNLDSFAKRSTVFDKAYCSSFPCVPARRDFITGKIEFPFRGWGPLEEDDITLPQILKKDNKMTALVTDHYHLFRPGGGNYHFDYDAWHFIRGICDDRIYTDREDKLNIDYQANPDRISKGMRDYYMKFKHFEMKDEEDWPAARTFKDAAEWVERNNDHDEGFHIQIDSFPPHEPFDPPPGYSELYDPDYKGDRLITPRYAPVDGNYSEREIRNIKALYAGTITYVDKWFGYFIDKLEEIGCMEDTVIIVSSDHGTYTGDHGWTGKVGTYMYDCVSHVPLIIYYPSEKHKRIKTVVSNCDVVPTLVDVSGSYDLSKFHGKSLIPLIKGEVVKIRDYVHSGFFGIMHVINDGRFAFHMIPDHDKNLYWYGVHESRFVQAGDLGPIEISDNKVRRKVEPDWARDFNFQTALFDLQQDPDQENNIVKQRPELVERFKNEFIRFCDEVDAPTEYMERYMCNFEMR